MLHNVVLRSALGTIHRELDLTREDGHAVHVPALRLADFGDKRFSEAHGVTYPYMAGAMAHGIASVALVAALAREGFLAAYGAAGLPLDRVAQDLDQLAARVGGASYAVNFIHSPQDPELEARLCELLIQKNIRLVEASAFMKLSKALVRYRVTGLRERSDGTVEAPRTIIGKVSRVEVARQFWAPPPPPLLDELLREGAITADEHRLAARIPMACDLTVEADSGGHTDNRPLVTLMPQMLALRSELQKRYSYSVELRLGAAGGLATPHAVLAAFSMGAAYVVTGTINQACVESGTSDAVRQMLAQTEQGDITMAPAADMFEMGVKVQVLKRGTMFAMRGHKLYEFYRQYPSLEAIPEKERQMLEDSIFRQPLAAAWQGTEQYFRTRDPGQILRAQANPKHKMALLFRAYLGQASHWATQGLADRRIDYQVWCGPAMPAFNDWVRGSFMEPPTERRAAEVALNLLYGAAVLQRVHIAALQGLTIEDREELLRPRPIAELKTLLGERG
jgi:trans-AT polyketide synthase/acyltransferase/oxidoreductase domain-containing protein